MKRGVNQSTQQIIPTANLVDTDLFIKLETSAKEEGLYCFT